jgi:hypothetical protein
MRITRPPTILPLLLLLVAPLASAGCAAGLFASRPAGSGPRVFVADAACRTVDERGAAVKISDGLEPRPDAQMCEGFKLALREALSRSGFVVTDAATPPPDLVAKVVVTQHAKASAGGTAYAPTYTGRVAVTAQVAVSRAGGDELDRAVSHVDADEREAFDAFTPEAAEKMAEDLASSPELKGAGLSPRG